MYAKFSKILIVLSIILMGAGICEAIPLNPGKEGQAAFLGSPEQPSTYTGTWQTPLTTKIKEGTITTITKPVWKALPDVTYTTFDVSIPAYGTYSYTGTFTTITDFIYTFEYIVITINGTTLVDYFNFNVLTDTNYDKLILGAEITPSAATNNFKPPISVILKDNRYKVIIQNKSPSTQNFKVGIIIGSHRTIN